MQREFIFERATKRTYRFAEVVPEGDEPLVGVIYIQKHCFDSQPEKVKVTVEVVK